MLGVLLGLVLVEQRHDLPDHVAHRIIAQLLGDRDELDAVLGEPADVELKLKLVAEEAAEAVDDDDIEGRRLGRSRIDHALELGPPIVGRRHAGLDMLGDDLPAALLAIAFGLAALVRDGEVAVGLSAGRDSQIEGDANRRGHGDRLPEVNGGWRTTHRTGRRTRPRTPRSRPRSRAPRQASRPLRSGWSHHRGLAGPGGALADARSRKDRPAPRRECECSGGLNCECEACRSLARDGRKRNPPSQRYTAPTPRKGAISLKAHP